MMLGLERTEQNRLHGSLGFSLLLHAVLLSAAMTLPRLVSQPVQPKRVTYLEVVDSPSKPASAPNRTETERLKNRIVETTLAQKVDVAPKDAYLGEQTQRVDRETVSMRTSDATKAKSTSQRAAPQVAAAAKAPELARGDLSKFGIPILPAVTPRAPTTAAPLRTSGEFGKSPEEYIRGVAVDERTALNTKEFIFFGYYQRIRQRLDRAWVPLLRAQIDRIYKRGRQLASEMDHTTRVLVVLNGEGEVVRVEIKSQSGTRDLDDAAIGAFNQAGPFPNPPKGLVDPQGEVRIPWEFILRT